MSKTIRRGPLRLRPYILDGKPTGEWQLDIPPHVTMTGRRERHKFPSRQQALDEANRQLMEIRSKGVIGYDTIPLARITLNEATRQWCENEKRRVRTLKKRKSSLESNLHRLKSILTFMGKDDVARITSRRMEEFQEHRLNQGRRPSTVNADIIVLRAVMKWSKEQGFVPEVPTVEPIPENRKRVELPTQAEVSLIISALPSRLGVLARLLAETGCRKGEAFNLEWEDVNLVGQGYVEVRPKEGDGWTPKTRQSERRILLSDGLRDALASLSTKSSYVFPGRDPDKPMDNFRKALAAAAKKAGVKKHITPQTLRKAFMTWQAERGIPEHVLQAQVGHAPGSRVTKRYYIQATEEAKEKAVFSLRVLNAPNR